MDDGRNIRVNHFCPTFQRQLSLFLFVNESSHPARNSVPVFVWTESGPDQWLNWSEWTWSFRCQAARLRIFRHQLSLLKPPRNPWEEMQIISMYLCSDRTTLTSSARITHALGQQTYFSTLAICVVVNRKSVTYKRHKMGRLCQTERMVLNGSALWADSSLWPMNRCHCALRRSNPLKINPKVAALRTSTRYRWSILKF